QVVQIRRATIQPMPHMMTLTPGQGTGTAWKDTTTVTDGQGGPLGRGDDPGGPADGQGAAGGATQDPGQLGQHRPQQSLQAGGRPVVGVAAVAVVTSLQGLAGDDDPGDGGVTGQSPGGLGFQRPGPADLPTDPARLSAEAVEVDDHAQLGPDPTRLGQLAALQ